MPASDLGKSMQILNIDKNPFVGQKVFHRYKVLFLEDKLTQKEEVFLQVSTYTSPMIPELFALEEQHA